MCAALCLGQIIILLNILLNFSKNYKLNNIYPNIKSGFTLYISLHFIHIKNIILPKIKGGPPLILGSIPLLFCIKIHYFESETL